MAPPSACFPVGVALAATWNVELVERVGQALGQETRAKGAHILLAPTVNIHRSPLAGRNFECYSEDPYLTGRMAVAYIQGLQSQGVGACIKHFVCNDSEFERMSISSMVTESALREIYLPPFRAALCEARPWAVMSAYNKINDVYCSENRMLLLDILKGEWGFDGIVISDWYGTYTPAVFAGGMDLEMPGPARWIRQGAEEAQKVAALGGASQSEFNALLSDKVRRLLRTLERAGLFKHPELQPEQSLNLPEHRLLARQAAAEAIVLLKNDEALLPIDLSQVKSIAVIGQNAHQAAIMGGGSSEVTPHYAISPLQGIQERAGKGVGIEYALGCPTHRAYPHLNVAWLRSESANLPLRVDFYPIPDFTTPPAATAYTDRTNITWSDGFVRGVDPTDFTARLSTTFCAPETGRYAFSLSGNGIYRLWLDGKVLIDHWSGLEPGFTLPWDEEQRTAEVYLAAGQEHCLEIDYRWKGGIPWRELHIRCLPPLPADPIGQAVTLAQRCDLAVVFAGNTNEWESEGFDRPDMELPGNQVELIARVAAANPRTIVVLNSGSPFRMPWLERVPAVLQAWFGGQEAGHAIADVLFGDENPSGRLPTTFPERLEDNPAYINYPGENGRVYYGEGIFVGYRYYDKKDIAPLFPFGHGLSYTIFEYRNLQLSASSIRGGETLTLSVEVKNAGTRLGKEVVQVYVRDVKSTLARPPKELKAFAKIELQPGEIRSVEFVLDGEALAFYDDVQHKWIVEPGEFEILVGASSRDIRLAAKLQVAG
jgi:beta-glucosidase